MENENVFKKLRYIAAKVEKESKQIERCINMPAHMRPGARSAELILKELQCNVQTMTLQAQKDLKELQAQTSFQNLLENVEAVVHLTRERLDLLEENLEKYGYKKLVTKMDSNVKEHISEVEDKENIGPDETEQEQVVEQHLKTPKRNTTSNIHAQDDITSRTPTLADFGISRATLDFLAKQNMASQRKMKIKTLENETPFKKMPLPSSPTEGDFESPFDPNVVLTPGLFGYGRKIPTATPEHMEGSAYLNSPVPPVLQTPGFKQMTRTVEDDTICFSNDATTPFHSQSIGGIHPTPNSFHGNNITQIIPQPKSMWQAEKMSDNTPTMPDIQYQPTQCLDDPHVRAEMSKSSLDQSNGTPTEPQLMAGVTEKMQPEGPVLLSQVNSGHSMRSFPMEPRLLSSELTTNQSATPTPFQAFKNFHIEDAMPQTPELTFSYARYVDVGASLASSKDKHKPSSGMSNGEDCVSGSSAAECDVTMVHSNAQPTSSEVTAQPITAKIQKPGAIDFISEEEFLQQSSILQRLLPLADVNVWIKKINKHMAKKKGDQHLLESDISNLGMGPRAKAMLLLLVKLKRLGQAGLNASGDQTYFVI